jgi:SAM-dependent methyltransferase
MNSSARNRRLLLWTYRWVCEFFDPLAASHALRSLPSYLRDWKRYRALPGAEPLRLQDGYPKLLDRTSRTPFDPHYFYSIGWALRRIIDAKPPSHYDVGSHNLFANALSAVIPVTFIDYRPLAAKLRGLTCVAGDILDLPFESGSISSLSCLHVAEHIGLGRYGDPLDANGTRKAVAELARVLAPGGRLYFALPMGVPRVCFNAHRIHSWEMVLSYSTNLRLLEFSGVTDEGNLVENIAPERLSSCEYGCGLFLFSKPDRA